MKKSTIIVIVIVALVYGVLMTVLTRDTTSTPQPELPQAQTLIVVLPDNREVPIQAVVCLFSASPNSEWNNARFIYCYNSAKYVHDILFNWRLIYSGTVFEGLALSWRVKE